MKKPASKLVASAAAEETDVSQEVPQEMRESWTEPGMHRELLHAAERRLEDARLLVLRSEMLEPTISTIEKPILDPARGIRLSGGRATGASDLALKSGLAQTRGRPRVH